MTLVDRGNGIIERIGLSHIMEGQRHMTDKEKIRIYHDALADILCWIDGFCASGNGSAFHRINVTKLRELKSDLYGKIYGKSPEWLVGKDD